MAQSHVSANEPAFEHSSEAGTVRATQNMVGYMGFCWSHPSLTAIEVFWRWLFGIPFLLIAWSQAQRILVEIPPAAAGLDRLEWQNPWLSVVLIAQAIAMYEPLVLDVLRWLAPVGIAGWAIASALGRITLLMRMQSLDARFQEAPAEARVSAATLLRHVPGYAALQAIWLLALLGCFWLWFRSMGWASATYLTNQVQPDLVSYLCWLIFLSLGIFTLWSLLSWTLAVAPVLLVLEGKSGPAAIVNALATSIRLGKALSGKLLEVNLVMAIVKIALIVLAMVFSAAPLPFSDEFGSDTLHAINVVVVVWYLVANDFFQVVRMRSFVELWRHYRG